MMTSTANSSARAALLVAREPVEPHIGSASGRGAADAVLYSRSAPRRGGFTLVEIILVLVILVTMGAIAWPSFTRAYESSKLKATADKMLAVLGKARVQAMTTGQTQAFRCQLNSRDYAVEQIPDDSATLDADATSGTSITPIPTAAATPGDKPAGLQLPEGYVFSACDRTLDDRTAAAEATITSSNFDTSVPPVLFYADGTSSDAQVTVANQNGRTITITLRSLTGTAHTGEVTLAAQPGATQ
jgi:type II secretory pathway pseudopilin PulG